jgi:diguanylate cyclase (GGDEF)-like protein
MFVFHITKLPKLFARRRAEDPKAWTFFVTIRGHILLAFLAMSVIIGTLGGNAIIGIRHTGDLVNKTYDESLMAINYARAAATDFAQIRAAFARMQITRNSASRESDVITTLKKNFSDDLQITVQRSQSARAKNAAMRVKSAADTWEDMSRQLLASQGSVRWEDLDNYARKVDEQIELLVNYTAGDGFLYRQSARATVARELKINIIGTAIAIFLLLIISWALARRIVGPIAAASNVAERIASGELDVSVPRGSADELGDLLASMGLMRDNIKSAMQREVTQRRSAQTRLADAIESSQEGIVVVDSSNHIALANAQAADFLRLPADLLKAGRPLGDLPGGTDNTLDAARVLTPQHAKLPETTEMELSDGRWLRISRSKTRDGGFIVVCSDVTLSKRQKATLHETNERLDTALENMSQGLCMFDPQNRLEVINRRFFEIFDLPDDQIQTGVTFRQILELSVACGNHDGKTADDLIEELAGYMQGRRSGPHYYDLGNGRVVASVYRQTSSGGWVATFEDVTERRRAEQKILHMARHDSLTSLPNRILFQEKIEQVLSGDGKCALLYLDLDRFKAVNDSLGHPIGDLILSLVTERLLATVRDTDTVARLGGDEFAIVQVGAAPDEARALSSAVIEALSMPFDVMGHQVIIGTSVGIAMAPADGSDADQLLRNADMALYRAKSEGRGKYHFFEAAMDAAVQDRHVLELDLRRALSTDAFELYYQPFLDLKSRAVSGLEALIRWHHPSRGLVSPTDFIPLAEEIGLITQLGDWVLKQACHDAASWPSELKVAVNLSAAQFRSPTLPLAVATALSQSGLPAQRLELEITESVLLQNDELVKQVLTQIRALGVRISMDDFGTGFSSLSYLRSFPFDKIKIDRSFIQELGTAKEADCISIVRAIIQLGNNLGMTTTAEGVETKEQLELLRAEGCDQAQGFLLGRPTPASQIPALLAKLSPRLKVVPRHFGS